MNQSAPQSCTFQPSELWEINFYWLSHPVYGILFNIMATWPDQPGVTWPTWASLIAQLVRNLHCNAGDPSSIPGLGTSTGKGIGYPLQYSWASLVAQLMNNPPATWETWVWSLGLIPGLGRSPGEGKGYPLQYFGLENSTDCAGYGVAKSRTRLSNFHFFFFKSTEHRLQLNCP